VVDVGRPADGAVVVVLIGSNDGDVARDGDRGAEPVSDAPVGGRELLLHPRGAHAAEDVGRASVDAVVVVPFGPDDGDVARDRDGDAEPVFGAPVTGGEFLLLHPRPAGVAEDVGRAAVEPVVVVPIGADDGDVAR